MSEAKKQVIVVRRGVKINGEAHEALKEAGIAIVRGNPEDFSPLRNADDTEMLESVLAAFRGSANGYISLSDVGRIVFTRAVARRNEANAPAKSTPIQGEA